ncbi:hypothetical protein JW711_04710 [Candidatus Woesearchaeota archaeon]|nr:hypothetical protein [Candidatus Woesearchaeota archaeon]
MAKVDWSLNEGKIVYTNESYDPQDDEYDVYDFSMKQEKIRNSIEELRTKGLSVGKTEEGHPIRFELKRSGLEGQVHFVFECVPRCGGANYAIIHDAISLDDLVALTEGKKSISS